jgi:hypothetical protein
VRIKVIVIFISGQIKAKISINPNLTIFVGAIYASMARKYFRNIGLFILVWMLVMLIYALAEKVSSFNYLWKLFLLPALFLGAIAALATFLESLFKVKKGINWIFLAVALLADQLIKIYLFSTDWESLSLSLIEPVFYIEPTHNTRGSYLWVLRNINRVPHFLNILIFSLVGFVSLKYGGSMWQGKGTVSGSMLSYTSSWQACWPTWPTMLFGEDRLIM